MGYCNPIFKYGREQFITDAVAAGVDGLIIPDLPPEEGRDFFEDADRHGIDGVLMATPTTPPERMKYLVETTRGFLYYVSLTGVTGARAELAQGVEELVGRVRATSDVPACVGFGVSTPEHARRVGEFADGVVVGSALVERIAATRAIPDAVDAASEFVAALKAPLRGSG